MLSWPINGPPLFDFVNHGFSIICGSQLLLFFLFAVSATIPFPEGRSSWLFGADSRRAETALRGRHYWATTRVVFLLVHKGRVFFTHV